MSHNNYLQRQKEAARLVRDAGLDGVVLEDTEGRRSSAVRYLTGLPQDGLLFVFRTGRTVLCPWDIIMAERTAAADSIIPLTRFERRAERAIRGVLETEGFDSGAKVELPARTPCPVFRQLEEKVPEAVFSCPERGVEYHIDRMRARKEPGELGLVRKAAGITNEVIDLLAQGFEDGSLSTELETALFIERAGRERGAEGLGFETIAAGPGRSFGIHAFPSYTGGPIGTPGLSIIDFGYRFDGYTSDVTLTIARGSLSDKQKTMLDLVQRAHDAAVEAAGPGVQIRKICGLVEDIFAAEDFSMPHSLGHGIGLEAHEAPAVSTRAEPDALLESGMVITIEPGLYSGDTGGVRLENDLLITDGGAEVLTRSRILRLP